jgi:hypothetical protein
MADKEAYRARLHQAEQVLDAHFNPEGGVPTEHDEAQKTVAHCDLWAGVLSGRPELPALNAAVDELDSGFHNLASGQYHEAYGSLRLSLELGIATIHFSVEEFALRQWLRDKKDIIWAQLIQENDKDKYLLTSDFVSAFNEDMGGRWNQYRVLAATLHRELSTHVHGAASKNRSSRTLTFKKSQAIDWLTKCQDAHLSWQYVMLARYSEHLLTRKATLSSAFKDMLRAMFGNIDEARAILTELGCN